MELKDYLFFCMTIVAVPWILKQGYNLFTYSAMLREEAPECYKTNPQFLHLFIGTCVILTCVMVPV